MSVFSDLLNQYIKEKEIRIYSMAAACQMDRSMLYRIISGKRNPPSLNIFRKIAEYLQLAPAEYEQLKNAYDLTRLGMSVYYKRKSVEDFFVHFPSNMASGNVQPLFRDAAFSPELPSSETACIPIFSKTEIDYYAHGILLLEASREKGHIRLLIQPDCPFLFGTLSSLRLYNTLTIDHVICFSRSDQLTSQNQLYTLSYLENMLPLFFADMDYRPYYFYDDVVAHYQNFNGFPCMILTSEYAIVCTSDYQKGFLYKGAKYLQLLHSLYHSYQEKCKQLFEVIRYLPMDGSLQQMYQFSPSYVLQPEACLMPLFYDDLLASAIYPDLPDREAFIQQTSLLLQTNRKFLVPGHFSIYFTVSGLQQFLETGRIQEIPEELYRPLTLDERKQILTSMLPYCNKGIYRILKHPLNQLTENLHLVVNHTKGYLLFKDIHGQILCLTFKEPGLLGIFLDYFESLGEDFLYTGTESEKIVKNLIATL